MSNQHWDILSLDVKYIWFKCAFDVTLLCSGVFCRVIYRFHDSLVDFHLNANQGRYALLLGGVSIGKVL